MAEVIYRCQSKLFKYFIVKKRIRLKSITREILLLAKKDYRNQIYPDRNNPKMDKLYEHWFLRYYTLVNQGQKIGEPYNHLSLLPLRALPRHCTNRKNPSREQWIPWVTEMEQRVQGHQWLSLEERVTERRELHTAKTQDICRGSD